ncbi:oligosaccharide flippase family protein, partial [Polynucleobacter paneuropaeus]|nr:oligosaccharide flippase family protein [Polynucleobacter paneuropaeus]
MKKRNLIFDTFLYTFADLIVLMVGSYLLLPLYTRMLSQEQFGEFVVFRANTEIITYIVFMGLPSAIGRLYFQYKKNNEQIEYLTSVLLFSILSISLVCALIYLFGPGIWRSVYPEVSVEPYLFLSVLVAITSFYSSIGSLWLRMDEKILLFIEYQLLATLVLIGVVYLNLVVLGMGLKGVIFAMFLSASCSIFIIPLGLKGQFKFRLKLKYISESVKYGYPIMLGYFAYYLINRSSILILGHNVTLSQIAIFGLA